MNDTFTDEQIAVAERLAKRQAEESARQFAKQYGLTVVAASSSSLIECLEELCKTRSAGTSQPLRSRRVLSQPFTLEVRSQKPEDNLDPDDPKRTFRRDFMHGATLTLIKNNGAPTVRILPPRTGERAVCVFRTKLQDKYVWKVTSVSQLVPPSGRSAVPRAANSRPTGAFEPDDT